MDFLLETIGFPPGEATVRWMAAQARRGGPRRVPAGPGMAVFVERGVHDGPLALWPSLIGGSPLALEVAGVQAWPGGEQEAPMAPLDARSRAGAPEGLAGIQGVLEARLRAPLLPPDGFAASLPMPPGNPTRPPGVLAPSLLSPTSVPGGEPYLRPSENSAPAPRLGYQAPATLRACLVAEPGAERGPLPALPRPGETAWFELAGFALDVEGVGAEPQELLQNAEALGRIPTGPNGLESRAPHAYSPIAPGLGGHGPRAQMRAIRGHQAPLGCVELLLPIRSIKKQINHLTGRVYERLEAALGADSLTLFVSRWQLEQDRLPRPEPGAWIRGIFWLEARLLPSPSHWRASALPQVGLEG